MAGPIRISVLMIVRNLTDRAGPQLAYKSLVKVKQKLRGKKQEDLHKTHQWKQYKETMKDFGFAGTVK